MALLEVEDIHLRFGGVVALDGPSFSVDEGQVCGLIGPNGAGKTTLFNCISRVYTPDSGRIRLGGQDLLSRPSHAVIRAGIARTFQNVGLIPTLSVLDNVMAGGYAAGRTGFVTAALRLPGTAAAERRLRSRAHEVLSDLGLDAHAHSLAAGLPFGTLKRIEIARALLAEPRLLLLDEPASGLTHGEVDELAATVLALRDRYRLTVLLVEHHMAMVMSVSDKVVALEFGRKITDGTPAEVREHPEVVRAYLGDAA